MRLYTPSTKSQAKIPNDSNILHWQGHSKKCNCAFVVKHRKITPVYVTGGVFYHTNGLLPSADQLVVMKKRSGQYNHQFQEQLQILYLYLNSCVPLPAKELRSMLCMLIPKRVL